MTPSTFGADIVESQDRGAIWEDHLGNRGDIYSPRASRECISPPQRVYLPPQQGGVWLALIVSPVPHHDQRAWPMAHGRVLIQGPTCRAWTPRLPQAPWPPQAGGEYGREEARRGSPHGPP